MLEGREAHIVLQVHARGLTVPILTPKICATDLSHMGLEARSCLLTTLSSCQGASRCLPGVLGLLKSLLKSRGPQGCGRARRPHGSTAWSRCSPLRSPAENTPCVHRHSKFTAKASLAEATLFSFKRERVSGLLRR